MGEDIFVYLSYLDLMVFTSRRLRKIWETLGSDWAMDTKQYLGHYVAKVKRSDVPTSQASLIQHLLRVSGTIYLILRD